MNTLYQKQLLKLLCQIDDADEMAAALNVILTDNEQEEVNKRLQIFALLEQNVAQREIAAQLGVGIATVTRGAKAMRTKSFARIGPKLASQLPTHSDEAAS